MTLKTLCFLFSFLTLFFAGTPAQPQESTVGALDTFTLDRFPSLSWTHNIRLRVRVGVRTPPEGRPILGDVFFFPGFADRFDNHPDLFKALNDQGLRVISFDYPDHGETTGTFILDSLNFFGFKSLAALATDVLRAVDARTQTPMDRPLTTVGWSTGGLLMTRMLQEKSFPQFDREIVGAVGITPGVAPRVLVGSLGIVTLQTLTQNPNPPYRGSIRPRSPFLKPLFAIKLLFNAVLSWFKAIPASIFYQIHIAGDYDRYTKSEKLLDWAIKQKDYFDAQIEIHEYPDAFHDLTNEPDPVGTRVNLSTAKAASNFVRDALNCAQSFGF